MNGHFRARFLTHWGPVGLVANGSGGPAGPPPDPAGPKANIDTILFTKLHAGRCPLFRTPFKARVLHGLDTTEAVLPQPGEVPPVEIPRLGPLFLVAEPTKHCCCIETPFATVTNSLSTMEASKQQQEALTSKRNQVAQVALWLIS